ncbi:MAG: TrkA C-terminal domain-containing protein [Verrucomicrobia bacterium]|nr:TrkA C-terminal domain-containing protein [Verrucomicrobiota bacterium]
MNLIMLLLTIIISIVVIRLGAATFHLTGLEWSIAKSQSLSCFTGTGFTTAEAELITGSPQRRRIASFMMILGNAGLVTIIATFANSLRAGAIVQAVVRVHPSLAVPALLLPWFNLIVIIFSALIIYLLFTKTKLLMRITDRLQKTIITKGLIKPVPFHEILMGAGGYGVFDLRLFPESPLLGRTLAQMGAEDSDLTVLSLERDGQITPHPPSSIVLEVKDRIVCFGQLSVVKAKLHPHKGSSDAKH